MAEQLQMSVDGAWVDARSGATFDTTDPATGAVLAPVPRSDGDDIAAARRTFDAAIWTRDVGLTLRTAKSRPGRRGVDQRQPAGSQRVDVGGDEQSGIGRELGPSALDAYLDTKQIYVNLD